jgi:hypothetical protein
MDTAGLSLLIRALRSEASTKQIAMLLFFQDNFLSYLPEKAVHLAKNQEINNG